MTKILICICLLLNLTAVHAQSPWSALLVNDRKVSLNLKTTPIAINEWFSKASGITIIFDGSLKNTITLYSPVKISLSDCFDMYQKALSLQKMEMVKENKWLVIRPQKTDNFEPMPIQATNIKPNNSELKVIQVNNNDSSNLARIINELFAPSFNIEELIKFLTQNISN